MARGVMPRAFFCGVLTTRTVSVAWVRLGGNMVRLELALMLVAIRQDYGALIENVHA